MKNNQHFQEYHNFCLSLPKETQLIRAQYISMLKELAIYTEPAIDETDSYHFGWLRGKALELETMIRGKWVAWLTIIARGEYDPKLDDIPLIQTVPVHTSPAKKMLDRCMNSHLAYGYSGRDFIEWLGYGLGISYFHKPDIPNKLWNYWYHEFDISLLFLYPADYISSFLYEYAGQGGVLDYYPTPSGLSVLLNRCLAIDNSISTESCLEPCVGAGSLLMENNSINLVATDLNLTMVKATTIQAFLYMPYLLYVPKPILNIHVSISEKRVSSYFEFDTNTRIYRGNFLLGEYSAPRDIFNENTKHVDIFINPLDLNKHSAIIVDKKYRNKDWYLLSIEERWEVVIAQARHLPFERIITNPPFSSRLDTSTKQAIETYRKTNQVFLEDYYLNPIIHQTVNLIESRTGQLMFDWEEQISEVI